MPASPALRRRSTAADPLKKVTIRLRTKVTDAVRVVVESGDAPSTDAFVEDAVIAALRERRRQRLYAAYAEAAEDQSFMKEMADTAQAYEVTLHEGRKVSR